MFSNHYGTTYLSSCLVVSRMHDSIFWKEFPGGALGWFTMLLWSGSLCVLFLVCLGLFSVALPKIFSKVRVLHFGWFYKLWWVVQRRD